MKIHKFQVVPALPEKLLPLTEIAYNLRWTWDHDSIELFRRVSKRLWESAEHNPVRLLGEVDQEQLTRLAEDEGFLVHLDRVSGELKRHLTRSCWFDRVHDSSAGTIAYFSAEFGLTESMPIYSGGLGILAGDHLKSCSELGVPLVGVGLLYQKGYFQQYLTNDGWQQERYPVNDFHTMPVQLERGPDGRPLTVRVELAERVVQARIWRAQVGRVPLILLDTNIPENPAPDQDISDELYGGDREMRARQEILLGIGGMRALRALGRDPVVCHMNEGHSAFLAIERIRGLMERHGLSFDEALVAGEAGNVFTTHTPVPAGIDLFPLPLATRYLQPYAAQMKVPVEQLIELGRVPDNADFSMAVLAIRLSNQVNGVSRLHGAVSRRMFGRLWPDVPDDESPIGHVTNGVHARSWISYEMATLYDRYLGPRWTEDPSDQAVWESIPEIPDAELWRTHERRRERLVAFTRRTLRAQLERRGAPAAQIDQAGELLDPAALTIGFARRVVPYKRTLLIFQDFERIVRLLSSEDRPLQIIFAGKAHPEDDKGKSIIRDLVGRLRDPRIRVRAVFIENYDMMVARYMVQGVDVWLNTPRRPLEASGTSGMKAGMNGALNLSILDGWWDEAYSREVGWAIGHGEEYTDEAYQDMVESRALYDLLENEIVPMFYTRGTDDIPRAWTARMKEAMRRLNPVFNSNRMVCQYVEDLYLPSAERLQRLTADDCARTRRLAAWIGRVRAAWSEVRIESIDGAALQQARVGDRVKVRAIVFLGSLSPEDVAVQICHGRVTERGEIGHADIADMRVLQKGPGKGAHTYEGELTCRRSGEQGYTARVLPAHEDLRHVHELRLVRWLE
ncbi:MAG: alpha-glucan family phosphorylase [Candidatus Eisenbacteria bacterium]